MALIGVSNGAIQFMAYEELKKRARERKVRKGMSEDEAMDLVRAVQAKATPKQKRPRVLGCAEICRFDVSPLACRVTSSISPCPARRRSLPLA